MKAFPHPVRLSALCLVLTLAFLPIGKAWLQESKGNDSAAKVKPRELEEFVQNLPKAELSKLRSNKAAEAAVELTGKLKAAELGKEGTFVVKVGRVETFQVPEKTDVRWRVECEHDRIKSGSVALELWCFVSIDSDPSAMLAKARPGQELTVSGKITRSDILMASGQPQLWVDIEATSFKVGK